MTVFSEVARILEEELGGAPAKPLDTAKCALMSFDHWAPEDLIGEDPDELVRALDGRENLTLVVPSREEVAA